MQAVFDGRMTWDEAYDLTTVLLTDPGSRVGASVAGFRHPWSHEAEILADLHDDYTRTHTPKAHQSRWRPRPRPYETGQRDVTRSAKPTLTQDQIRSALARLGH